MGSEKESCEKLARHPPCSAFFSGLTLASVGINVWRIVANVLCTGIDRALLETRKMVLEHAGHSVTPVTTEIELQQACETTTFDVAVIGQSVSRLSKRHVFALIKQYCPSAKVLELYSHNAHAELEEADASLCVPSDIPHDLVERVEQLVPKKRRKRS